MVDDGAIAMYGVYTKVEAIYSATSEHKAAILAASKAILDAQQADIILRTARDILGPVKTVMEGLDALSTIHPFVKGSF